MSDHSPAIPPCSCLTNKASCSVLSVLLLSLSCAFVFGLIFLLFTTFPTDFEEQYHFSSGISGLSYLGVGIGVVVSLGVFATTGNKLQEVLGDSPKPEGHQKPTMWIMPAVSLGIFWYGWTAEKQTCWSVPIICSGFFAFGLLLGYNAIISALLGGCFWPRDCRLCVGCKHDSSTFSLELSFSQQGRLCTQTRDLGEVTAS